MKLRELTAKAVEALFDHQGENPEVILQVTVKAPRDMSGQPLSSDVVIMVKVQGVGYMNCLKAVVIDGEV